MKKKLYENGRLLSAVAMLLAALGVLFSGNTVARYISSRQERASVTAREFRFESNYLTEDGADYTVHPGSTVEITITNTDGLTVAEDAVTYEIKVTGDGTLTPATENKGYTLAAGATGTIHTYTLTGTGEVTVTAKATKPYAKTLSATFTFKTAESYYTVADHTRYVQVDIYTVDAVNGITVSNTGGLTPDSTNKHFNGSSIGALEADSHYTFVYFKSGAKDYTPVKEKTVLTKNEIKLTGGN